MLFTNDKNDGFMWNGGTLLQKTRNAFTKKIDDTPDFKKEIEKQEKNSINAKGDIKKVRTLFEKRMSGSSAPNLTQDQVQLIKDYHSYLEKTGQTMEQLPIQKFAKEQKGLGIGTKLATQAFKGLGNVVKSVGAAMSSMLVSMAASYIITKVIGWIEEVWVTAEEAKQALNEFTDAWDESHKKIQEDSKALPDLVKKYKDLVDGVDSLGNNMSLTDTEYSEYLDTVSKISEAMPSLTTYFNEQGQAIGFARGELDDYNQAYKRQIQDSIHEKWYGDGKKDTDAAIKGVFNKINDTRTYEDAEGDILTEVSDVHLNRIASYILSESKSDAYTNIRDYFAEKLHTEDYHDITQVLRDIEFSPTDTGSPSEIDDYVFKRSDIEGIEYGTKFSDLTEDQLQIVEGLISNIVAGTQNNVNEVNQNIRKFMLDAVMLTDDYLSLDTEQMGAVTNLLNKIDFTKFDNVEELNSKEDYEGLAAQLVKGAQTAGFSEAMNQLLSKDLIEAMPYSEAKDIVDKNIKTIGDALNWSEEQRKQFRINVGFDVDKDNDLIEEAAEKTGLTQERVKELFSKEELELICNVKFNIIPGTEGDEKSVVEQVEDYADTKNYNEEVKIKGESLANAASDFSKYAKEYGKIADVVNGKTYLTAQEMADLTEELPELAKHLQLTKKGWTLEAGAMEGAEKSAKDLQVAYIQAQQYMTSTVAQQAMQRISTNQTELASINSLTDAYKFLMNKGITLTFDATGNLDTSVLSEKDLASVNTVLAAYRQAKLKPVIDATIELGKQQAKNDKINQKFQIRIEQINSSLEKYTKQLDLLKRAQDDLYENDYVGKIDYINQRYEVQSEYTAKSREELDKLLQTVPETAEGWNTLASAVENVSQQFFESQRAMMDYGKEVAQCYMDAAKAVGEFSNALIDESTSQYDRNVKMLTEGGLGGLQFGLTPIVPQDAIDKQREENEKLLKLEEEYQEKVDAIKDRALQEQLSEIETGASPTMQSIADMWGDAMKFNWEEFKSEAEKQGLNIKINYIDSNTLGNGSATVGSKSEGTSDKWASGTPYSYSHVMLKNSSGQDIGAVKTDINDSGDHILSNVYLDGKSVKDGYNVSDLGMYNIHVNPDGSVTWTKTREVEKDKDGKNINIYRLPAGSVTLKAKGGDATGDIIVNEEGQESYLGKDGKLHLFKEGAQFFNTDEVVRVFNAEDTKKILKHTGDKYFKEPVGDLSSVTQLANGNISAIFPATSDEYGFDINTLVESDKLIEAEKQAHFDKLNLMQLIANKATSDEQLKDKDEKISQQKRFTSEFKEEMQKLYDWIKNNPILAPDFDEDSWKNLFGGNTNGDIIEAASKYIGTPYVWGGDNAAEGGLDCSGYVYNVLKDAGYDVQRTTAEGYRSLGNKVNTDNLQPGDILFFGKNGEASHIAIYAGNGQMYESTGGSKNTASNPGKGVVLSSVSKRKDLIEARRINKYASGTKEYGVAGENYKREYLIDKKTGQWTEVNSPTLIDTNEVEVVGEKASAKINKPLPMYANGTPTTDEKLLSIVKTVCEETGIPANVLLSVLDQETGSTWIDSAYESSNGTYSYGYMMINDAHIKGLDPEYGNKVKTDPYTNVLEGTNILMSNFEKLGNWADAASAYNQGLYGHQQHGRNKYGDEVWNRANTDIFVNAASKLGEIAGYTSQTADNTSSLGTDFSTTIKNLINGSTSIPNSDDYNSGLLEYIKATTADSNKSAETYIANFDKLQEYQDSKSTYFKDKHKELLASVGTPEFARLRDSLSKEISDSTYKIMGMSVDMEATQIKEQYEFERLIVDKAIEYYNLRKSRGATAEELAVIANSIEILKTGANESSDKYVDIINSETEVLVSQAERNMKAFDDNMSWYDDDDINSAVKRSGILVDKISAANQGISDLYNNADYAEIIQDPLFEVDKWFDANGELTSKFYEALESATMTERSDLIPFMKQFAQLMGVYKKNAVEATESLNDLKIDTYIKYQERLAESLDFESTLNQSLTSAKENLYDFMDSLREEKTAIDKELKANMQIDDWLTEDTRKLLFNLDDYEKEMGVINNLQSEAEDLYANYQAKINNLKEDELYKEEEITAEYNRQMESLQEKLSIAKAELQVAKDKAAFENALMERDTQIIMGNRIQNVADPERLRELAEAKAESENELENLNTKSVEAGDIRSMEAETGLINLEKAAIQNRIDMINSMSEFERKALADFIEPIEIMGMKLDTLNKINPDRLIRDDNSNDVYLSRDFNRIHGYSLTSDHSANVSLIDTLINNRFIKSGTPEYDVAQQIKEWSMYQHDDKTTSDAHNYGYFLYDPNNAYLWNRGALKMYDNNMFSVLSKEYSPIDKYIMSYIQTHLKDIPVISGEGEVVFDNSMVTVSDFLKNYREATLPDMISKYVEGVDESMLSNMAKNLIPGSIAPSATNFANVLGTLDAIQAIGANTDNRVIMENVTVNIEKPVTNANQIVQEVVTMVDSEYAVTRDK